LKGDPKIVEAKVALRKHFVNKKNEPVRTPYYHHQLQVLYEGDFFEWIVTDALKELEHEGYVTSLDKTDIPELGSLAKISRIKFYANSEAVKTPSDLK